ncbi:type III secretion system stator protein SctL [Erwinia tasmaniensis]|uniref:HrpE protein (Hrp cluster) n=1 Tax=Erwinia tasmaniensis (strain DSM 17950 / CFBP 7177 / CIP 109463 / NCPPB 4357 / Et1/99) TaxID=465817 RepID=B2VGB7_ERWT9|nr:type III secretion system stator protein SctL [Erwinia tasmaniensis]CAO95577.1 HrpE protein (hrp cluster) [Erwinia tasmaniensis Et1/99]
MLTRKRITLLNGAADLAPVISQSQLFIQQQGQDILEQARQQAQAMRDDAERQIAADRLIAQQRAGQAFWQQADTLLHDWQQQYQQLEAQVLEVMDGVMTQALGQLLDEVPEPQRLAALLRQIMRASALDDRGSLYCHPSQQNEVADWLHLHAHLGWRLQPDGSLAVDGLKLVTANGELHLDWQQAVRQLLPTAAEC